VLSAKLGQNNQQQKKPLTENLTANLPAFIKKSKPLVGK
jgi:hypothetical protein